MAVGRAFPHAVLLGDGRVLVVGDDSGMAVPDDSAVAELWDPATQGWQATAALNAPRGDFVEVGLNDGRVLVAGGLDQASTGCDGGGFGAPGSQESFSSTYLFDARSGSGAWTKAGLLGTARTAAAGAVLADGRVLVAGGYFYTGNTAGGHTTAHGVLAAYRPGSPGPTGGIRGPNDVVLPPAGIALATAELFDPVTGTWSSTGALRYARFGAAAVTLTDGRVLVVGSEDGSNGQVAKVADGAYDSAEIYDPATGRFSLTGSLPAIDRTAFAKLGPLPDGPPQIESNGTLMALKDGGALLVGQTGSWKHEGAITRSLRFDAATGRWTEVGSAWATGFVDPDHAVAWTTPGPRRGLQGLVARLADGRVLVAGGLDASYTAQGAADLFDPATNAWSNLPPMPESRAGGATVALKDGSVLLIGGFNDATPARACAQPGGLSSTVRFVPQP